MDSEPPPTPVTARDVLNALSEVRRKGRWPLFQELESDEPDLTAFVLEETTTIHRTLMETGARPKAVRRLQRQIQSVVLVCVLAFRNRERPETDSTRQ